MYKRVNKSLISINFIKILNSPISFQKNPKIPEFLYSCLISQEDLLKQETLSYFHL